MMNKGNMQIESGYVTELKSALYCMLCLLLLCDSQTCLANVPPLAISQNEGLEARYFILNSEAHVALLKSQRWSL